MLFFVLVSMPWKIVSAFWLSHCGTDWFGPLIAVPFE